MDEKHLVPTEIERSNSSGVQILDAGALKGDMKEKLDFHLQLAKKCVEEVHGLPTQKFNNEQCSYLVSKLEVAVEIASLFLEWSQVQPRGPYITMYIARQAKNLELLVALAKEIESFVQSCSKDTWMESALTLAHAAKYVSSLGFNLELCKIAFGCRQTTPRSLMIDEVCKINKDEVEIVVKKASRDKDILLKNVTFELNSSDGKDRSLAKHLVHQLLEVQPKPTSDDDNVLLRMFKWVVSGKKTKQLGRGSSATVYEVKWFGIPAAKKTFIGGENEDFIKEVEILSQLRHPNITSMFCCHMNKWSCSIIMELMDGDLRNMMSERQSERNNDAPPFTILEGVDLMLQVGEGVNYLHDKRIVHRDLKSSNILVKNVEVSGLGLGYVQAKVVDFGLSKTKEKSTDSIMTYNTGSYRWMAPELINITKADEESFEASEKLPKHVFKVDIYSFALVCFEILTGELPFISARSVKRVKEMVLEGERPKIPYYCPQMLKSLIEKCWSQIPLERPSISDVCLQLKYIKYLLMTDSNFVDACESMVTNIVPTKMDCGPNEIFAMHHLHPQVGDISTSVRATLIFFHGFHKGPKEWRRTWMTRDNKLVWPQEWLPEDLGTEYLRVLSVSFGENTTMNNLQEMGKNLVNCLVLSHEWKLGESGEAIFLIGHSFGGVLIKNLVTEARHVVQNNRGQQEAQKCEKFLERLGKIVFYSVPHAEFENYISECKKIVTIRESSFLQSLEGDLQFVTDMNKLSAEFENAIPEKLQILAFFEGKAMSKGCVMVTENSFGRASNSWEWHKIDEDNHFEVCRPNSKNHTGYRILLQHLHQHLNDPYGAHSCEYPSPFLKQRAAGNSEVKRGDAILISMEKNSGEGKDRPGAGVDRGRLETLFGTLCFNVHTFLDHTAEYLKGSLKSVADTKPDETSDSFVLFVSAHGNTDNQGHYIIASDGQQVYIYEDIIKVLTNSDALKGIPKVFFVNACRGDSKSRIRPIQNVVEYMKSAKDTLVIFSTDEGNECNRDTEHGTFFVQTLNDVIIHNHENADVLTMAQMANKRLIEKTSNFFKRFQKKPKCQVQNIHSNMTGNLFWRTRHSWRSLPDMGNVIVGQDHQREKLKNWLMSGEIKATGSECFVISGMGGIGKTTLTKSLFEDENIKYYYDHLVYWVTIKKEPDIMKRQRRLISEICKETPSITLNTQKLLLDELKTKLSRMRRIFLVLDDVWETKDVDSLLGDPFLSTLPRGSKCIITSRKPAELQKLDASIQVENLELLNKLDAAKLFLCKAFRRETVDEHLRLLVDEVVDACGNMPILLATIGADQWSKSPSIASLTEVRDRLKTINEDSVYQKLFKQLKISYDDLPVRDSIDFKDSFQDLAAFPDSEEIEISVLMDLWTKPGLTEDEAYKILEELEQRCLLKIDGYWCHVHDIFRALAVELAQESPVSKRKRLFAWGLLYRLPEPWGNVDSFETEKMVITNSELKEFHPNDAILFKHLPKLRMLFLTSNLNLVTLPPAIGYMRSLAKLDLSWCLGLKHLPQEIGQLESLEKLNMAGCCSLAALPPSIGNLRKLMELNMQSCGIKNLPDEIGELTNLTYLCLNDCDNLQQLPEAIGKLSSLEKLDCELLKIKKLPSTLGNLSSLKHLSFAACGSITEIPAEFANLKSLISCCFTSCHRLNKIPHELETLGNLEEFKVPLELFESLPPRLRDLQERNKTNTRKPEVGVEMRGVLVNPSQVFHPSDKEERRASFGLARIISVVRTEPFLSQRFDMGIRLMYTMANHDGTRHAIVRSGGLPVLLRCIDKGDFERCGRHAAATLRNICVAYSTHKAVVDAGALSILTRVLHRKNDIRFSAYQALTLIMAGDVHECDYTFTTHINELCGHSYDRRLELDGELCIYCRVEREFRSSGVKTQLKS